MHSHFYDNSEDVLEEGLTFKLNQDFSSSNKLQHLMYRSYQDVQNRGSYFEKKRGAYFEEKGSEEERQEEKEEEKLVEKKSVPFEFHFRPEFENEEIDFDILDTICMMDRKEKIIEVSGPKMIEESIDSKGMNYGSPDAIVMATEKVMMMNETDKDLNAHIFEDIMRDCGVENLLATETFFIATFIYLNFSHRVYEGDFNFRTIIDYVRPFGFQKFPSRLSDFDMIGDASFDKVIDMIKEVISGRLQELSRDIQLRLFVIVTSSRVKYNQLSMFFIKSGYIPIMVSYVGDELQGNFLDVSWKKVKKLRFPLYVKFMIEDTSLFLSVLKWKMGPYIKELMEIGPESFYELFGGSKSLWVSTVVLKISKKTYILFSTGVEGEIVRPGSQGYDFDLVNSVSGVLCYGDDIVSTIKNPRIINGLLIQNFFKNPALFMKSAYKRYIKDAYREVQIYASYVFVGDSDAMRTRFHQEIERWHYAIKVRHFYMRCR